MRTALGIVMVLFAASVQAGATLDCAAPPYYLSFIVSAEHGPQSFSFLRGSQRLASGNTKDLKAFEIKWPNRTFAAGNYLKIEAHFPTNLDVLGQVDGDRGKLLVNGKAYVLQCYWTS